MKTTLKKESQSVVIESIGAYLPDTEITTSEIVDGCAKRINLDLEQITGIQSRRVAQNEFSINIAKKAALHCLAKSKFTPDEIDVLIACNISRYDDESTFSIDPNTSIKLIADLKLNKATGIDVSNACAGFFTSILVAISMLKTNAINTAMIVSGEYITHLIGTAQREIESLLDTKIACLTLGDAGVAIILERSSTPGIGFRDIELYTMPEYSPLCIAKISDHSGGGAIMNTNSFAITKHSTSANIKHLEYMLAKNKLSLNDINCYILHQISQRVINHAITQSNVYFEKEVLSHDNTISNVTYRGNTATTTHILAFYENLISGNVKADDLVAFIISGSGLTVGSALYKVDDLPSRVKEDPSIRVSKNGAANVAETDAKVQISWLNTVRTPRLKSAVELAVEITDGYFSEYDSSLVEIDLILYAGMYRDEFLFEPALAAIIANELVIKNESAFSKKLLAFDIYNSSIGFFEACYIAENMIKAGTVNKALILSVETAKDLSGPSTRNLINAFELGSGVILSKSQTSERGFSKFHFQNWTDHIHKHNTVADISSNIAKLKRQVDPDIDTVYLTCIIDTVKSYLLKNHTWIDKYDWIFMPQMPADLLHSLVEILNIQPAKLVVLPDPDVNYFNSSMAFAFQSLIYQGKLKEGEVGLVIAIGTGIQIGCTSYYF